MVMMRGDLEPLVLKKHDRWFCFYNKEDTEKTEETESDGTEAIPNSDHALFFGNRLLVPYDRDFIGVSDYLNYTRYSPNYEQLQSPTRG